MSEGFVYFIRQVGSGLTKIGLATNPLRRFGQLQSQYGCLNLWLTLETTDMLATERWFHCLFADEHVYLEWFRLTPDQLSKQYLRFLASEERRERLRGKSQYANAKNPTRNHSKRQRPETKREANEMNINTLYPSKYLSASDCEDEDLHLTIRGVRVEQVGEEQKPMLYFQESEKPLVLNKTNAKTVSTLHGAETNDWKGKRITLYSTEVEFGGKTQLGIRIRLKAPKATAVAAGSAVNDAPLDDDPFADE